MGVRTTDQRRQRLRAVLLVAASLTMLLATAPGLVAQEASGGFPAGTAPDVELDPAEEPSEVAPRTCAHAPGEFLVGYVSEEAFQAAPTENVVGTFPEILVQHLAFPEVADDPAAEEAKRQELSGQPGVAYVEYDCTAQVNQATAPEAAPVFPPASCVECGKYVVDKAKKIIGGGADDAEGKDAYEAALETARTANDDVALASETESDEESAAGSEAEAGSEERGSEESGSEEESLETGEEAAPGDAEAGSAEEVAGSDTELVSQKNVLPGGISETAGSPSVLALGAGVLLLAAGLFVARRILWK